MRLSTTLLCLAGLIVGSVFCQDQFPKIHKDDTEHTANLKRLHHTWDPTKEAQINHDIFREVISDIRNNVTKVSGPNSYFSPGQCTQPGYTGQYCEFPICSSMQETPFEHEVETVIVDFGFYPLCAQPIPLYIDNQMFEFVVEIQTPGAAHPMVAIYNSTGGRLVPNKVDMTDATVSTFTFDWQPAGIYEMIPVTDIAGSSCYLHITAASQMDVHLGFIAHTGGQDEVIRNDFPSNRLYSKNLNLVVAHAHGLYSPGSVQAIEFFQNFNTMTRPYMLQLRYGCSFDRYFDGIYAEDTGSYFAKVAGYDLYGNSFRRVVSFKVEVNPNGPATPTTTPPTSPTTCQNNGTLITNADGTTSCYCTKYFQGNDCSQTICMNGGTDLGNGNCLCLQGFSNFACQDVRCTSDSGFDFPDDYSIPTFVIRVRQQMANVILDINNQLTLLKAQFASEPEWFQHFGLVVFNNNGSTFDLKTFDSVEALQGALLNYAMSTDNSGDCLDNIFQPLATVFNGINVGKRAPVYVFTDAMPSDVDYAEDVSQLNSYFQSPIIIFQLESSTVSCRTDDYFTPGWKALERITTRFSGNIFFVGFAQYKSIGDLFYNHMVNVYYHGDLLYSDDIRQCTNQLRYSTLSIDSDFEKLVIVGTGQQLTLALVDPTGNHVVPTLASSLNDSYIWTYSGLQTGQWQFQVLSTSPMIPCSVRAYSSISPTSGIKYPNRPLYWGWSFDLKYDAPLRQPVAEFAASFAVRIGGEQLKNKRRISAELSIYEQHSSGKVLAFASNGIWRDECQFELFFAPYICHHPDELLYFTIFLRDDKDIMIQRAGTAYCSSSHPTQVPVGTCQNGAFTLNNTCVCPNQYSGQFCQNPVCMNGGTSNGRLGCLCAAGTTGQFCQYQECIATNPEHDFTDKKKNMIFLLDVSNQNVQVLKQLKTYMGTILRDIIDTGKNWIETFVIITYDDHKVTPTTIAQAEDIHRVIAGFNDAYQKALAAPVGCVNVNVWKAFNYAGSLANMDSKVFNFQSSLPNEDSLLDVINAADILDRYNVMSNSFINAVSKDQYQCGGTWADFHIQNEVCEVHEGKLYAINQAHFLDVIKLIPSYYSSGVVYKKGEQDCTGGCNIYFPLDAYAQNAQLFVHGDPGKTTVQLFKPDSTMVDNLPTIVEDQTTGWTIVEARRACPVGYDEISTAYCYKIVTNAATWADAQADCQNSNGFLMDDMNADKDSVLQQIYGVSVFWLGLNSLGEVAGAIPSFKWDRGTQPPHQLTTNDYTIWDPTVDLKSQALRCAYRSGPAWFLDDCATKKPYMCQMHKFIDSFDPSPQEEVALPGGKWYARITSPGQTTVQVRVQSKIQVTVGYTLYPNNDFPDMQPRSGATRNMFITHVSGMSDILKENALYDSQLYDMNDGTMYAAATYQQRLECSYQFISQPWSCPNTKKMDNAFTAVHVGVDVFGFTFQRMTSAHCEEALEACGNGGAVYNGACVCGDMWTGKLCNEITMCMNGGTLSNDKTSCSCSVGFTGYACQYAQCTTQNANPVSQMGKTFALVLENTQANLVAITNLKNDLGGVLAGTHLNWFTSFVLVTFDSTNNAPNVQISTTVADFKQQLQSIQTQDLAVTCNLPIFRAMTTALGQLTQPQSILYTVTRGVPGDLNNEIGFVTSLTQKTPQFIYHGLVGDSMCKIDWTSPLVQRLQEYTIAANGNFYATSEKSISGLASVIIPALFEGAVLANPTFRSKSCNLTDNYYVMVDRLTTTLTITIYGDRTAAACITPSGNAMLLINVFQDTDSAMTIYQVNNLNEYGMYTFKVGASSKLCFSQIRGSGGAELYLGYVPTPSMTNTIGSHLDNSTATPNSDFNIVTGVVVGDRARLTYAEVYNLFTDEFQYLKFYYRNNCTFTWFSDPFRCTEGKLLIVVYGIDIDAQQLRRETYTECLNKPIPTPGGPTYLPPTVPTVVPGQTTAMSNVPFSTTTSTPSTSMKGDVADIFLIIDTSTADPKATYATKFHNFIASLLIPFKIDAQHVNVAYSPSPGDNNIWISYPSFSKYTSLDSLLTDVVDNFDPADGQPQTPGQAKNLGQVLALSASQNFLGSGYTAGKIPHLIIYLTSSSTPSANAINTAQQIRTKNLFNVISISYGGIQNNNANLKQMSDCVYTPTTDADLGALATTLSQRIDSATKNNGVYTC